MSGIPQKAEPAPWWSKAPPRAPTVRETPDPQTVVFENGATAIRFPRGWKPTVEDFTATSDLPRSWTPLAHEESENFVRAVEMGFQFPVAQSYLNLDGDLRAISLKPDATYEEIVRRLATIEKTLQGRFVVRDPLGLNLLQDACKRLQKNLMLPMGNGRYVPHAPVTRLYVPVRFPQGLRAYLARHFPGRTVTDFLKGQALKDFQREGEAALGPDRVFHQRLEIFGAPIEGNTALSRRVAIRMEFHDFPKERKELIETKPFHEIRWALINGFIPGYEQGSGAAPETAKRVSAQEVWQINQGRAAFATVVDPYLPESHPDKILQMARLFDGSRDFVSDPDGLLEYFVRDDLNTTLPMNFQNPTMRKFKDPVQSEIGRVFTHPRLQNFRPLFQLLADIHAKAHGYRDQAGKIWLQKGQIRITAQRVPVPGHKKSKADLFKTKRWGEFKKTPWMIHPELDEVMQREGALFIQDEWKPWIETHPGVNWIKPRVVQPVTEESR